MTERSLPAVPEELARLADRNTRVMRTYGIPSGNNPSVASEIFASRRYSGAVSELGFRFALPSIEPLDESDRLMDTIAGFNPGMLLVRPDMYHHRDAFVSFLLENGFIPHYVSDVQISQPVYEQMYFDVFKRSDARPAFPNRTLIYTDSPATLIVFSDPTQRYGDAKLADNFFDDFKGKQGEPDGRTVRGKVVFDEAVRLGYHKLDNPVIAQAVDPLGSYREAVKSKEGPHAHLPDEYKLLNYTGVGVHVPNFTEMMNDLPAICDVQQLEEIQSHLKYPYLDMYKWLWQEGVPLRPFVIALGGYAGTSKSTLAQAISDRLPPHLSVATPHLRSLLKDFVSPEENPWLYVHTYDLDKVSSDTAFVDPKYGFRRQIEPVATAVKRIIDFVGTERQHHIIEGNHIFPGMVSFPGNVLGIELYLKVSDPELHKKMMVGPTHRRAVDEHQFAVGRELHDYTVAEAERLGLPVFEFNQGYDGLLKLLNEQMRSEISRVLAPDRQTMRDQQIGQIPEN